MIKKICVVTGTRAEYGLFYPLLKEISSRKRYALQIIASGMHLSPEFGLTYKEIKNDGFKINKKIPLPLNNDTPQGITKSIGSGLSGFAKAFKSLKPDLVILLGDRFETFSAAIAAYVARIPIAHIHGGELSEGAIDEAFRHSITKMSHLHFVSTDKYRKRVIQLGEDPSRVFNTGALGIDNIVNLKFLTKPELEKQLSFKFGVRNILVTFHPATLEDETAQRQFRQLLSALDNFNNLKVIFTKPNADTGAKAIAALIDKYVKDNPDKAAAFTSLGRIKYLSMANLVDAVAGNSSSGIIEAPSLGKPSINIGDRQRGRVKANSVIDSRPDAGNITKAVIKALSPEFKKYCLKVKNPYGTGCAAKNIIGIIGKTGAIKDVKKRFYDLG